MNDYVYIVIVEKDGKRFTQYFTNPGTAFEYQCEAGHREGYIVISSDYLCGTLHRGSYTGRPMELLTNFFGEE